MDILHVKRHDWPGAGPAPEHVEVVPEDARRHANQLVASAVIVWSIRHEDFVQGWKYLVHIRLFHVNVDKELCGFIRGWYMYR